MTDPIAPRASEPPSNLTSHEYDGIHEYDNPMPRWWRSTFWGTFFFACAYYFFYQLTGRGESTLVAYEATMREYREEVALKALGSEMTEEGLAKLMANKQLMADARTVFSVRCMQCHADRGQGNIGPNLTDLYWLHGDGSLMSIYKTASNGELTKGMPAWGRILRPMELAQVVAYVGSIHGTNLPGKEAQGTLFAALPANVLTATTPPQSAAEVPPPARQP